MNTMNIVMETQMGSCQSTLAEIDDHIADIKTDIKASETPAKVNPPTFGDLTFLSNIVIFNPLTCMGRG